MSSFRIYFVHPWLLLFTIPLVLITLWPVFRLPKVRRFTWNRKLSLALHSLIIVLLVALLADMTVYRDRDEVNTVLLVDYSASTEDSYSAIDAYVKEIAASAGEKNRISVVAYGKDVLSLTEFYEEEAELLEAVQNSEVIPECDATNLEEALYYADSLLNDNENQRIILISDGIQTDGDALAATEALAEQGVFVDSICIPTKAVGYEMQVNRLSHPENLKVGEEAEVTAVVQSNYEGAAEIQFMDNGAIFSRRIVTLKEGLTELMAEYTPDSLGVHELSAKIVAIQDDISENNVTYSWFEVGGLGNILLVDGTGRESALLSNLLSKEYSVTVISPEEATGYANQLAAYQGVILMNVSNADLPEGFDKALEIYVEKYGGGLLTSGGGNTYAYGEMTETVLEDLLPVTLEKGEEQTTAMMIVVDTSSSMKGLNHEMAIQGTMQCIETLAETDYVGVLTFDRTVHVIYDLASMEYEDAILEAVEQIELGKGTYMTNATQEAYNQLKDFEADNKHVIILSDGEPQDAGYIRVVKQMAANGITVSAIAVGHGADRRIMQVIAETGGGNYYNASSVNDLPDIMVEETVAAIDSYRQTGDFPVSVASYSTLLGGVDTERLPAVSGYMTTFLKRGAEQFLTVNGGEPLYVQWNYGTGSVGSFTADLRGSDSEELYRSEDGQQLIKNMVAAVIRGDGKVTALEVAVTPGNQTAIIDVSASLKGKESIVVTVLAPDNKEQIVETILTTDGTCQGVFDSSIPGTYTVTVTHLSADGELLDHTRTHFASSYSAEYDAFTTLDGEALLAQISEVTGGKMSYTLSGVLDFTGQYLEQELDPTVALLVVVLVLFLGDIAVRKFRLRWFKTQKTNKNV
ncbi:MAG: VWA domain-containing protein [Lachnospiraceae bacterium]|nr:VWA domain-containing protein [Lachnospiraceae bacterium]